jgi:hypothetical protein
MVSLQNQTAKQAGNKSTFTVLQTMMSSLHILLTRQQTVSKQTLIKQEADIRQTGYRHQTDTVKRIRKRIR